MRVNDAQITGDVEATRRKLILGSLALLVLFVLIEAPRGQHYFDKIKYNGSLFAYVSSLVMVAAGAFSGLNAYLLKYSQRIGISGKSPVSWTVWGITAVGFAWLACDKMLAVHERTAFILVRTIPSLHNANPSQIDGIILALYGLCSIPICIVLMRSLLLSPVARKYFVLGVILMLLSVGHDATESKFDFHLLFIDGETFEKLWAIFSSWAFASAFLTTTFVLGTRILQAWHSGKTDSDMINSGAAGIGARVEV